MLYWSDGMKRELKPAEVRRLPVGTVLRLEGPDRYGENVQQVGKIRLVKGVKKFLYFGEDARPVFREIKSYEGKRWIMRKTEGEEP